MSRFIYQDGVAKLRASDVREGDLLDLEGDPIADPNGNGTTDLGHYEAFEFEFAVVNEVWTEGPDCVVICTSQGEYGFPPEHLIDSTLDQPNEAEVPCPACGGDGVGRAGKGGCSFCDAGGIVRADEVDAILATMESLGLERQDT
jgi:hypothetical protein